MAILIFFALFYITQYDNMPIPLNVNDDFLDLFYPEIKDLALTNSNKLNLLILKVTNNAFVYNELIELLGNKLHYFALSRNEIQKLKDSDNLRTLIDKSKDKLRNHLAIVNSTDNKESDTEGGELGELLLFCLLESHLKAPKILTKLELKTSNQMYVNGADGVHLLKIDDKNYQLIFGESKLNSSLSKGISNSFDSIGKLLKNKGKKRDFEIDLINSQLVKEAYDENIYKSLKQIIIPSAKDDLINMDHSFGIFLGFNVKISDEEKKLPNETFRTKIREKIKLEVEKCIKSINTQIAKSEYSGYNFYIYIIPFSDLPTKEKKS